MKKKNLLSLLLAVAMILSCIAGVMAIGAGAEGANKIVFAVGDLTVDELDEGAIYAADIMSALSVLDVNSRQHPSDTTAEIHIKGNLTGGDQGNLLFAQKTIWRADGTKLPISIIGHDTAQPRDAYIYLDGIGGWYTCANDYTFENLTLPVGDQETYFYAGSGNVRFDNVSLMSAGEKTVETVADRTAFYQNAKAAAEYIAADAAGLIKPDVNRLPNGDAWYKMRMSSQYHATGTVLTDKNGDAYVDKDLTGADGSLYGDYSHAGNTGGGQYLNACVYYEVILGLDCRENDWTPTAYNLDEDLRKMLQAAAHEAVVEVYGEDHFKTPVEYERQGDGVVNVLMMGSSSSYYMRDELHFMAAHKGIQMRVVHAYSSGIKMSTMWSWTKNENGKWTVYTEWDGKTSEGVKDQKMTDFVADYPWDAIVTYETGGSFNKEKLGVEGFNDTSVANAIAFCDKADEFINYVYDYNANNANARYFWFQTVGAPIGAPGPSSSAEGYVFGDNNTSAAYAGWTQADVERYSENGKVVSSITFGEAMSFGTRVNAVGYQLTAPETPYTDETAAQVEFIHLNGFASDVDVRPVNTLGKLILDSDTAAIDMTPIKRGFSPASAELHIKKGSGGDIMAYGYNVKNVTKYGDITFRWTGGILGNIDLINGSNITGDLNVIIDLPEGSTASTTMIRTAFNANVITGDVNVTAKNLTVKGSVYSGGGAGGTVTNTFTNCNITNDFFAMRSGNCGKIVNNFKDTTVGGIYVGGHWSGDATTVGPVINNIDGLNLTGTVSDSSAGTYFGGSSTGGGKYTPKTVNGTVKVDGKDETLAVYNNVKSLTAKNYYAGARGGTCGNIRSDVTSINLSGNYYGGAGASGTAGTVLSNVQSATVGGNFYGGSYKATPEKVTTNIYDITLTGKYAGANYEGTVNGNVTNNIFGGSFSYFNGGFICEKDATMTVKGDIINNIQGPVTVSKTFSGATGESGGKRISVVEGTVVNTFDKNEKGQAPTVGSPSSDTTAFGYYGTGHHTYAAKGVVNHVKAGTFKKIWQGGGQYLGYLKADMGFVPDAYVPAGAEKGTYSMINLFEGGTFEATADGRNYVWGGTIGFNTNYTHGALLGGVYTEVSGDPVFNVRFIGGHRGMASDEDRPVTVKISGGTFNHNVFMVSSQLGTIAPGLTHTANGLITGGVFNKAVYGGTNGAGSVTNCTLTVQGGTFNDALIASSYPMSGTTIEGSFTLTLEPTASDIILKKAVAPQNDAETIALKGGDKSILIDADATIAADSYDGKALSVQQTAGFETGVVYLTVPTSEATANIAVTKASGATGYVMKKVGDTETQWIGLKKASAKAVNLILDQKIDVRIWFDKAEVDTVGNDFTYAITLDGKTVASGTYADLLQKAEIRTQTEGGAEFYTLRVSGTEPASFHKAMTLSGEGLEEMSMSINDVLSIVIANENSQFNDGFVTLAKSLWNYGIEAYNRFSGETSTLTKQEISQPENAANAPFVQEGSDDDVKLVGRALVLREAVGIRIYLNLADGVKASDLTFVVNGYTVPESLLHIREESGQGYNASITLYVSAAAMDQFLTLSVHHGQIFAGGYTDSIASICQQYREAGGADAELCTAILRYIQAVPGMND